MWGKRNRPKPDHLRVPDDLDEARAIRDETRSEMLEVRRQAPLVRLMTDTLINRRGRNHYMELLYQHVKGAQ